jgi:O-phosphoseryl-tRNA(Cys) synthetase
MIESKIRNLWQLSYSEILKSLNKPQTNKTDTGIKFGNSMNRTAWEIQDDESPISVSPLWDTVTFIC